jgi:hypothetical protein
MKNCATATDLRNMFQDAHTGWLEIYNEAA